MDTITMTETTKGRYRYRRPREALTERVKRYTRDLSATDLADLAERWGTRSLRGSGLGLGDRARGICAAIALVCWAEVIGHRGPSDRVARRLSEPVANLCGDQCCAAYLGARAPRYGSGERWAHTRSEACLALLTSRELAARQGV